MRQALQNFVNHPRFENFILGLIILNAITLGLETYPFIMHHLGGLITVLDQVILAIFVLELVMRMSSNFIRFWHDPWRIFDFIVVAIALLPATGALSMLRAFRILRVLRLISGVRTMRRVVSGLLQALPGMGSIILLLTLIFYLFSVICTKLFGTDFPEWFGTIPASAYSLFQIMTLESWSMGIVRPVMEVYPYAWALFVPFIISTAFTVLNLFIGVIVDAMQSEDEAEARGERDELREENRLILAELKGLREEVRALQKSGRD